MLTQENVSELQTASPPSYEPASLSQRLFAFLLDTLVLFGLFSVSFLLLGMIVGFNSSWGLLGVVLFVALDAAYYLFFWTRPRGQTPGKRFVNNRIIRLDGSRLTFRDAFLRWIVSRGNSLALGLGWLMMLADGQKRGWHDRAAGTLVVLAEPSATADTAPFRPCSVAWGWLLIGVPGAAMMAAVNWQRLGKPERYGPTLLVGLVVTLALLTSLSHPLLFQLLPARMHLIGPWVIVVAVSMAYGFFVSRTQKADYETWRVANGGRHPSTHETGRKTFVRIILSAIAVNYVLSAFLVPVVVGATAPLLPNRRFTDQVVALSYPGGWWTMTDFEDVPFCQQPGVTCLLAGSSQAGDTPGMAFELERFSVMFLSAESADAQAWDAVREQDPKAALISREARTIDGHEAVERRYTTGPNTAVLLYIKQPLGIYRFSAVAPATIFTQQLAVLEQIIGSIGFVGRDE